MTSSGTTSWNPAISNLTLSAFERCGVRAPEITAEHMASAARESNLLQVEIGNKQPNIWSNEVYTITLTEGDAEYDLPARLIAIQDVVLRTVSGGSTVDRIIWPLSTFEWDALPNKTVEAPPTTYFFNRLINPTITFWQVPDADDTYTARVRMLSQLDDATLTSGTTLDMPYRFLDVFVAGLAHRMARIYAGDRVQMLKADYMEAWANASAQDIQDGVSMYIMPAFDSYYGR